MPDHDTLTARLEALEIRAAYQDQAIEDLNAALAVQWRELEKLRRDMALLETGVREALQGPGEGAPEPPPPHY